MFPLPAALGWPFLLWDSPLCPRSSQQPQAQALSYMRSRIQLTSSPPSGLRGCPIHHHPLLRESSSHQAVSSQFTPLSQCPQTHLRHPEGPPITALSTAGCGHPPKRKGIKNKYVDQSAVVQGVKKGVCQRAPKESPFPSQNREVVCVNTSALGLCSFLK